MSTCDPWAGGVPAAKVRHSSVDLVMERVAQLSIAVSPRAVAWAPSRACSSQELCRGGISIKQLDVTLVPKQPID